MLTVREVMKRIERSIHTNVHKREMLLKRYRSGMIKPDAYAMAHAVHQAAIAEGRRNLRLVGLLTIGNGTVEVGDDRAVK